MVIKLHKLGGQRTVSVSRILVVAVIGPWVPDESGFPNVAGKMFNSAIAVTGRRHTIAIPIKSLRFARSLIARCKRQA